MNGSALKLRRAVERHKVISLDTAPLIYYIEDVAPYADLVEPVFGLLENHSLRAVTSQISRAEHDDRDRSGRVLKRAGGLCSRGYKDIWL
jgi:hypothetical protein